MHQTFLLKKHPKLVFKNLWKLLLFSEHSVVTFQLSVLWLWHGSCPRRSPGGATYSHATTPLNTPCVT